MSKQKSSVDVLSLTKKSWTAMELNALNVEIEKHGGLGSKKRLFEFLVYKGVLSKRSTINDWMVIDTKIPEYEDLLRGIKLARALHYRQLPQDESLDRAAGGHRDPVDINPEDIPW